MSVNINRKVHEFLQKLPNLESKNIAVGYSAGADSTVLLHILAQKAKHFNFNLEAVFFSHSGSPINEGEDKNLELAKKTCKDLGIKLIDVSLEMNKTSQKSWEQLGREGRLSFYKKENYDYVFLGHHQDDQNETTMMQIMRGGGRGTGAMKSKDGIYCRPMLSVTKKDIYEHLKNFNIEWIEDPTNVNTEFTRNWWRNEGLPKLEEHYPSYRQSLENFRKKQSSLHSIAYDMAKIDGLEKLLEGNKVSVKNLSDDRVNNLLSYTFSAIGKYIETNKLDNWLKQGKAKKQSEIFFGDFVFKYEKDYIHFEIIEHNLENKKENKTKKTV